MSKDQKVFEWFSWYPLDFRRDTYGLTLEEDGAYRRLIDEYMITRRPLPNDPAALARIIGIPKTEYSRLAPRVLRYFKARNSLLYHDRCECELRVQNSRHNRLSERGKKGAFARYSKINKLPSPSMLVLGTRQDKEITLSPEPRARGDPPVETPPPRQNGFSAKQPCAETRAEMEARFAEQRAAKQRPPPTKEEESGSR